MFQPQCTRAGKGRGLERLGRRQRRRIVGCALGEQRREAHLAEDVEPVIAGGSVAAERHSHAGAEQLRDRRDTAGQLQVRRWAVHDVAAALCKQCDLVGLQVHCMDREQALVDQSQPVQAGERPHAMRGTRLLDLGKGLVQVDVDRAVELLGQDADALECVVGHRVRRMRCEREAHQRVVAQRVAGGEALAQVVGGVARVGARKLERDDADHGAHADAAQGRGGRTRVEIHVVAAGHAGADHLESREAGALMHEVGADQRSFERPDALVQPVHQRHVVAHATQQCHRGVRVRVDQARNQRMLRQHDPLARCISGLRLVDRLERQDPAALDRHRVALEYHAVRPHRDHPAAFEQGVNCNRGWGHRGWRQSGLDSSGCPLICAAAAAAAANLPILRAGGL